jgi:hypothetical protein
VTKLKKLYDILGTFSYLLCGANADVLGILVFVFQEFGDLLQGFLSHVGNWPTGEKRFAEAVKAVR